MLTTRLDLQGVKKVNVEIEEFDGVSSVRKFATLNLTVVDENDNRTRVCLFDNENKELMRDLHDQLTNLLGDL